jgi:hypothetical protein
MAQTKVFSINHMTTGNVADGTRLYFAVMDGAYAEENGIVAVPGSPTLAEKVFVQTRYVVENDIDAERVNKNADWEQVNNTNFPTLSAGFLADLKKIFDAQRTALGLDPV